MVVVASVQPQAWGLLYKKNDMSGMQTERKNVKYSMQALIEPLLIIHIH